LCLPVGAESSQPSTSQIQRDEGSVFLDGSISKRYSTSVPTRHIQVIKLSRGLKEDLLLKRIEK
jgi:hypothetical protein